MAWKSKIQGWIFPASSTYDATSTVTAVGNFFMLKPQYFMVTTGAAGTLTLMTSGSYAANGYSIANADFIKSHSQNQFVTISCNSATDMDAICGSPTNTTAVITQLVTFLQTNGFTGIELDWENFTTGSCTTTQYSNFLLFVASMSTALHSNGFQLMIDGPSINNNAGVPVTDSGSNQASYRFKYEDVAPYCDYVVMQIYDDQYEYGAGTPIAPNTFITNCCNWLLNKVGNTKAVAGMPAYGYYGATGGFTFHEDNYNTFQTYPGVGTATVDPTSSELIWTNGGNSYDYMNTAAMNAKRTLIESLGILNTSVWYIGGNQWFTGTEPSSPSSITGMTSVTGLSTITF
jgi:spore germination protein YaaH